MLCAVVAGIAAIAAWSGVVGRPAEPQWQFRVSTGDYADRATRSARLLEHSFYNGTGLWHMCVPVACFTKNRDWGADSLTYVLYLRWMLTRDPTVPPIMRRLSQTAHAWGPADTGSSDTVMWDAIADAREYQVTRAGVALAKAEAAFRWVDSVKAAGFASGACPAIDYQWPYGRRGDLKTLETASNYIKAALLLFRITGHRAYLAKAEREYTQVRHYFLTSSGAAVHRLRVRQRLDLPRAARALLRLGQRQHDLGRPGAGPRHRATAATWTRPSRRPGRCGRGSATRPASSPTCRPTTTWPSR